jgi:hypothetical protein
MAVRVEEKPGHTAVWFAEAETFGKGTTVNEIVLVPRHPKALVPVAV